MAWPLMSRDITRLPPVVLLDLFVVYRITYVNTYGQIPAYSWDDCLAWLAMGVGSSKASCLCCWSGSEVLETYELFLLAVACALDPTSMNVYTMFCTSVLKKKSSDTMTMLCCILIFLMSCVGWLFSFDWTHSTSESNLASVKQRRPRQQSVLNIVKRSI